MTMIRVLDKSIADKIAAGEVIERPISIVKELVENSIDSGAKSIVVEIKKGGKEYIRVTDDGCGIPKDQIPTAFLRHATSKISKASDLFSIGSLGFRGEALASIAAVTHTEVISKCKDSIVGTRFVISGSNIVSNTDTGCPEGSTFIISDLFFNTPVRKKFMKSDAGECALIIEYVSEMALAYADVKFRLINNGNIVFSTLGDDNKLNIISRIYADIDTSKLVAVHFAEDGLEISGYVSTPSMSKTTRGSQIFFVNGRVVGSKVIEKGITLGYKERLFAGRFPVAYLFVDVNPSEVDVNIHPNKREVRFNDEQKVVDGISRAINDALLTKEGMSAPVDVELIVRKNENLSLGSKEKTQNPFAKEISKEEKDKNVESKQVDIKSLLSSFKRDETQQDENGRNQVEETQDFKVLKVSEENEKYASDDRIVPENSEDKSITDEEIQIPKLNYTPFNMDEIKITGALFNTYITAVDDDNLYLIDQHAAHERIFYEKLLALYNSSEKIRQTIMVPILINVSLKSRENSAPWLISLKKLGFTIEEFGPDTYRISEIPVFMEISEAEDFINSFIESIGDSTDLSNTVVVNKIIMSSCKASVKANQKLKDFEVNALIKDLKQCVNPFSCPHGRPTFIRITKQDIERMFKRV